MTRFRIPPHQTLYGLHDRGLIQLPDKLLTERTALQRLIDHQIPIGDNDAAAQRDRAITDLLTAARNGGELLTRVDVAAAEADERARGQAQVSLEFARETVHNGLTALVQEERDTLITDVLAPVHDRIITEVTDLAPTLDNGAALLSAVAMAAAPAATRKASIRLDQLASDYAAIRDVWHRLFEVGPTTDYPAHVRIFGVAADPVAVGFAPATLHQNPGVTPWPTETLPRVLWLATHPEAKPWLPTPAQHDQRVSDVYADGIERQRHARFAKQAVQAWSA